MMQSPPGPAQPVISPDTTARDLERKLRRVDVECERRLQAIYPMQEQLFLMAAMLAGRVGFVPSVEIRGIHSQGYIVARDSARGLEMIRAMIEHRHAAEALKLLIVRNPMHAQSIDVASAKHWPALKGIENED